MTVAWNEAVLPHPSESARPMGCRGSGLRLAVEWRRGVRGTESGAWSEEGGTPLGWRGADLSRLAGRVQRRVHLEVNE